MSTQFGKPVVGSIWEVLKDAVVTLNGDVDNPNYGVMKKGERPTVLNGGTVEIIEVEGGQALMCYTGFMNGCTYAPTGSTFWGNLDGLRKLGDDESAEEVRAQGFERMRLKIVKQNEEQGSSSSGC